MILKASSFNLSQPERIKLMRFMIARVMRNPRSPEKWERGLETTSAALGLLTYKNIRICREDPLGLVCEKFSRMIVLVGKMWPMDEEPTLRAILNEVAISPHNPARWEQWARERILEDAGVKRLYIKR